MSFAEHLYLFATKFLGIPLTFFMRNINKYADNLLVAFQMDEKARY